MGGNLEYNNYTDLEKDFAKKELHPMDLKKAVAEKINELLAPVQEHFKKDKKARQLLDKVKSFKVTK